MLETEFIAASDHESRRLMVVLHGLGDSVAGYRWVPGTLQLPWLNYLLVNAPDPYFGGYSWYDYQGNEAEGIARSRQKLTELLDAQQKEGFSPDQTVLFGFSQGCLMTWEMGFRYPHRFAGLVGVSGYVHEPEEALKHLAGPARDQRFLITHGTFDPLIPFDRVNEQVQFLQSKDFQIQWQPYDKEHTIAGEEEVSLIRTFTTDCFEKGTTA